MWESNGFKLFNSESILCFVHIYILFILWKKNAKQDLATIETVSAWKKNKGKTFGFILFYVLKFFKKLDIFLHNTEMRVG